MPVALGLLAAFLASVLYSIGVILQSIEARQAPPDESLRPALLRRLVRRPRWVGGTTCVVGGWTLQAAALLFVPIGVVQPMLAAGLFVLLIAGTRLSDESVGFRDVLCVLAITVGVTGLAVAAPPQAEGDGSPLAVSLGLALVGAGALVPLLLGRRREVGAALVALGAGLSYAWVGFSTKFVSDALPSEAWLVAAMWLLGTVTAALIGLLSEMTALQRRSATRVFPIVLVVQIVAAVLLAPLLAGEALTGGALAVVATGASLAMVGVGTAALASTRAVGAAISTDS